MHLPFSCLLVLLSLAAVGLGPTASAQQPPQAAFYVSGAAGVDLPSAGIPAGGPLGWEPCSGNGYPTGWRTIGYAIQQTAAWLAANQPTVPSAVLYVEGGQAYSAATNGESFPIVAHPLVALEGTFCNSLSWPELRPAAGETAIQLTSSVFYNYRLGVTVGGQTFVYPASNFRYLRFVGGARGMVMGAGPGVRHRSRIEECEFSGQSIAGLQLSNSGSAIDDPKFYRCSFRGPGSGIRAFAFGVGGVVFPDVEDCDFRSLQGEGIFLQDQGVGGNVGCGVRGCVFEQCGDGVFVTSGSGATSTNATIDHCRFADIVNHAVRLLISNPFDPHLIVRDTVIQRAREGIRMDGNPLPGPYVLQMQRNTIDSCAYGVRVLVNGQGTFVVNSNDNTLRDCGSGIDVFAAGFGMSFQWSSVGESLLGNGPTGVGVRVQTSVPGSFALTSSRIVGPGFGGISVNTSAMVTTIDHVTVADRVVGMSVGAVPAGSRFSNMIFDRNAQHVVSSGGPLPVVSRSCFFPATFTGPGNVLLDPQLIRPFYKLAATSPCINAAFAFAGAPLRDFEGDPRTLGAAADIGADEFDFDGGARPYGTGGFGRYNVFPRISSPSAAVTAGGVLQVDLQDAIMPVFGVTPVFSLLSFGAVEDSGPLPFDLTPILNGAGILPAGWGAAYLWTDNWTKSGPYFTSGTGAASASFTLPVALAGATLTAQWLCFMPAPYGVLTSEGLRVTIR